MTTSQFAIRPERADDDAPIDALVARVFGPGMCARAAFHLRENVPHVPATAFVAQIDDTIVGTVRQTPILWGGDRILMLGPLTVDPVHSGRGIGAALMRASVEAAGALGERGIMLVGDLPYYAPYGFERLRADRYTLPRPADPTRVLVCELRYGALGDCTGPFTRGAR